MFVAKGVVLGAGSPTPLAISGGLEAHLGQIERVSIGGMLLRSIANAWTRRLRDLEGGSYWPVDTAPAWPLHLDGPWFLTRMSVPTVAIVTTGRARGT